MYLIAAVVLGLGGTALLVFMRWKDLLPPEWFAKALPVPFLAVVLVCSPIA